MSESVESVAPEEPAAAVELPGRFLRAAREAKTLTLADVAQALKFSARQLEALEADNHAGLPGVTFVRGAVRSYAKYLKLDPAPLLAMLDATAPASLPDVRPPQNMGTAMMENGVRRVSPLVAASMLLLLVAIVIGVWRTLGGPLPAAPLVAGAPAETAREAEQPVVPPQVQTEAATPAPTDAAGPPTAEQPTSAPAQVLATAQSPVPAEATPPALPAGTPAAVATGRKLVFAFNAKSWIEVKDASRQVIFTGEQPAGSRQTINGKPPFQLVIGNAAKVDLFDGERQVDLRPYTRAEVARLTLD